MPDQLFCLKPKTIKSLKMHASSDCCTLQHLQSFAQLHSIKKYRFTSNVRKSRLVHMVSQKKESSVLLNTFLTKFLFLHKLTGNIFKRAKYNKSRVLYICFCKNLRAMWNLQTKMVSQHWLMNVFQTIFAFSACETIAFESLNTKYCLSFMPCKHLIIFRRNYISRFKPCGFYRTYINMFF